MSSKWRLDFVDIGKDSITTFFWGAASRPCGPPALSMGVPLKAAAGQATVVKLQTDREG